MNNNINFISSKDIDEECVMHSRILFKCIQNTLGPVTKLDRRNKTTLKKFGNDFMSVNCDAIVLFPISEQLEQSQSQIPDI